MDIQLLPVIASCCNWFSQPLTWKSAMTKHAYRLVYRPEPDRLPRWVARLLLWF